MKTDPFLFIASVKGVVALCALIERFDECGESIVFMVDTPKIDFFKFKFHVFEKSEKDGSPSFSRQGGLNSDFKAESSFSESEGRAAFVVEPGLSDAGNRRKLGCLHGVGLSKAYAA